MRFDLSDEEWAAIEPLLPPAKHGPARVGDRRVFKQDFLYLAHWRTLAGFAGTLWPAQRRRRIIRGIMPKPSGV